MTPVCEDIYKAIHEGKWLKIEYKNQAGEITNYWIAIKNINPERRSLNVTGMHLGTYEIKDLYVLIDSILTSSIIEGTYCEKNPRLLEDLELNPSKYSGLFDSIVNLKILNYLEMCNRMDSPRYCTEYGLINHLDQDSFIDDIYQLNESQFSEIVKSFSYNNKNNSERTTGIRVKQLAMNVLSVFTPKGLYVLAYRRMNLDVKNKCLRPSDDVTICMEFQIDGTHKENIKYYLDADDYGLLLDFKKNQEQIKNIITQNNGDRVKVDDRPYFIAVGYDIAVDLHAEYKKIIEMYEKNQTTFPIRAFFGDLLEKPRRIKSYPIALLNSKINMDQLLAINKAMQYPTAYIQGPPGTGKTNTIINTIVTGFFNERTILFASNNNHPIDAVFDKLRMMEYHGRIIPFPVIRLGNQEKLWESILYIRSITKAVADVKVYNDTLDKRKGDRTTRAKQLTELLHKYEEYLELKERRETLLKILDYKGEGFHSANLIAFEADLRERQLRKIEEDLKAIPIIDEKDALALLDRNEEEFRQYLYFTSAKHIQRLNEEKYSDLREIIYTENKEDALVRFGKYLQKSENIKKLQRVFPIIITTCVSAHRLGEPEPLFDMTIIDEASQCNTAMALLPIIRGENLMLVGDPQQLNPVILLDEFTNKILRKEYSVPDEYDYRKNSIYKVFLASDSVSDEILLHNHYRCNPKIIGFNNKKYYNSKLSVRTADDQAAPLVFVDVNNGNLQEKNTSRVEADKIISYVKANRDKSIGIITPFTNQSNLINRSLEKEGLTNVSCGTVHSFQGDEKDIVLFSTALGNNTREGTYNWLKSNHELINVATSRPKEKLIILGDLRNIERLHTANGDDDDMYELVNYVRSEGKTVVSSKETQSRALGVKPYSTETENAFLETLNHALENIWLTQTKYIIHKEVPIAQVFQNNNTYDALFYTGRFDFVIYEKETSGEVPVLAIELDGKEHVENEVVRKRDAQKNRICAEHNLQLIRVENTYARRYNYIKDILINYFKRMH